jgi:hypothetical protein
MIVAPRLLPDEWAAGYWGRVLLLNGIDGADSDKKKQEFARRFCEEQGIEVCGANHGLEMIGAAAQVPSAQVLRSHTLIPLRGAVSATVNSDWFDDRHDLRGMRGSMTMQHNLTVGVLCPQCAEEDQSFWGFTYWRRSHQVHSIPFCDKHRCTLRRSKQLLASEPLPDGESFCQTDRESEAMAVEAAGNGWLRRYADVSSEFLNRSRPLSRLQVVSALARRARLMGIDVESTGSGLTLATLATQRLPRVWMQRFLRDGRHLNEVLRRFYCSPETTSYALAIALLYESTEDAFRDIEGPLPSIHLLACRVHSLVDEWAAFRGWTHLPIAEMRRRLIAGFEALLAGQDAKASAKIASCTPLVFEGAVVRCFAGPTVKSTGYAAGPNAIPPSSSAIHQRQSS